MSHMPTVLRLRDATDPDDIFLEVGNDHASGITILNNLDIPVEEPRQERIKAAWSNGGYSAQDAVDDEGNLGLTLRAKGADWGQATTRWLATRAALRSHPQFFVEVELSGVKTTWYCDARPRIAEIPINSENRALNRRVFDIQFLVQPNPTIDIA